MTPFSGSWAKFEFSGNFIFVNVLQFCYQAVWQKRKKTWQNILLIQCEKADRMNCSSPIISVYSVYFNETNDWASICQKHLNIWNLFKKKWSCIIWWPSKTFQLCFRQENHFHQLAKRFCHFVHFFFEIGNSQIISLFFFCFFLPCVPQVAAAEIFQSNVFSAVMTPPPASLSSAGGSSSGQPVCQTTMLPPASHLRAAAHKSVR